MAETEESDSVGDWRNLNSSSGGLFSAFLSDGFASRSLSQLINGSERAEGEKVGDFASNLRKKTEESGFCVAIANGGSDVQKVVFGDWKPPVARNGVSIAERRAARCGFNAPRLNTARFRSDSPLSSPAAVRSPYVTIPPGLSPTTLLDSPVMLQNSQALQSPTTGTLPFPSFSHGNPLPFSVTSDTVKDISEDADSSFIFKPHVDPVSMPCFPSAENQMQHLQMDDVNQQSLVQVRAQVDVECEAGFLPQSNAKNYTSDSLSDIEGSNRLMLKGKFIASQACPSNVNDQAPQNEESSHGEDAGSQQLLEDDQKGSFPPSAMGRQSEDGYNWRKYGQKQVKGSEFPRSYYKCTYPNCQVKKKVERSHDGQITEIIYKGTHNHPKPQPSCRSGVGSAFSLNEMSEAPEDSGSYVKVEGGSVWRSIQQVSKNKNGSDWRADGLERTSSTSVVTELSDPLSTAQGKHMSVLESADSLELSSTLASHDDDDDDDEGATHGGILLGDDGEDDESESKRRKKDNCFIETNLASRAVREPRVVVQTDSEVEILDDGYRWRKYGQKVVKGNPNPRSYYKCTNAGCSVRKHVERASHDPKSVITTYEGKHNHEIPAARNSSHINSSGVNALATPNAQSTMSLSGVANIPKPEPQVDLAPHFERKPELGNEYLKPGYMGRFDGDIKRGHPGCYEMKLPPLQPMSFGSFGHSEANQAASVGQVVPEFPLSSSMGLHRPSNLPHPGFDFNHGKPIYAVQPFLGPKDLRFLRPKQENDESVYDTRLPISHLANSSSPVYHQIMGGFQL